MPAFCWFYKMTPDQFRSLKFRDYTEMMKFLQDYHKPQKAR